MTGCLQCGFSVGSGAAFCQRCGAPVGQPAPGAAPLVCSGCGTQNSADTNFCHACGRRLGTTTPMDSDASAALASALAARPSVAEAAAARPGGPRLVAVRRDGTDGDSYPIPGDQIDIGRTDTDLCFEDPHLAARHARVILRAGQHIILPLESRNGVYLRIHETVDLVDGNNLLVGKQVLRFEVLPDVEKTLRPAVEHGIVLFGTPQKAPWGRLRQLTSAGTTRDVYHLTRADLVLGREQGDIVFSDDEFMSRRHALLQYRNGRTLVTDLGSSNGTFLRLIGQHVLTPGEMIRLGDELLRFEMG